jgi:hypothetical protein
MWKIQVFAVMAVCALFGLSLSGFAGFALPSLLTTCDSLAFVIL